MTPPLLPANEDDRLRALRAYDVLDTEAEAAFDRLTQMAATLFEVPMAIVSLVDAQRQWFKSKVGFSEALADPLTRLPNRRAVELRLTRAMASTGNTCVVLFDIDHFKRVNDVHGHNVGDDVLRLVGKALQSVVRGGDVACRWGGEEFMALVAADRAGAVVLAERARLVVQGLSTPAGPITLSAGVAPFAEGTDAVSLADAKLYEAKHTGRNRVCS